MLLSHAFELVDGNRGRELLTQVFHTLSFGELAVDGFFIISGYLILQSWLHGPEIVGFLRKRILRIYPAFIVAVIVSVLVFGPYATTSKFYFHLLDHEALLRSTIRLMPPEVPRPFTKMHYPLLNGAMWTIAYEFRCYVLVALLGLLGLANRAWVWLGIGAVSLALFTVLPTGTQLRLPWSELLIGDPVPAVRFISLFCSGALLFLWREKLPVSPIVVVGAGLVLAAGMFSPILAPIVLCSVGAYLLWVFAFAEIPPLRFFQTAPDISYGTYLYGWPIEELLIQYHPDWTPWVVFVAATALCYALGWVSWTFIEKLALRFKAA